MYICTELLVLFRQIPLVCHLYEHELCWCMQVEISYYDYVRDYYVRKWGNEIPQASADGLYEFSRDHDMPFSEPASVEEELKKQLTEHTISPDDLT